MVATNQIKALLSLFLSTPFLLLVISGFFCSNIINGHGFSIREACIRDIQQAFTENKLTSRQLVEFYLHEIQTLNPLLRAVIDVNPDALDLADKADWERSRMMIRMRTNKLLQKDHHHHHHCSSSSRYDLGELHGIPVLLKDTIATKDKLNTTAGSYALLGSVVPRDAGVVKRLRRSGALIMGKASLSEWAHIRSFQNPDGWRAGAVLVDNLEIDNVDVILHPSQSGELTAMVAEFKQSVNVYLKELITSPVRSLADVIAFNEENPELEKMDVFDQDMLVEAESTSGMDSAEVKDAVEKLERLSIDGFERMMMVNELDAMVSAGWSAAAAVLAIGGHPGISVPAAYDSDGMPVGICFGGLRGSEPKLIEIAYAFEQMTLIRKPPFLKTLRT
ncbi:Amidase [Macleaya cordata]|uniref:Amidase n=1 Tax=Macleaya cordata TaxID=56857 RepID=A0A200RAW6_MACCD|nr:Amidase [Macleaya cordata]